MNLNTIYEFDIEEAALDWFASLDYTVLHGPDIAPDTPDAERTTYKKVVLERRLRDAVARLNPQIPVDAQEEAIRKVLHPDSHTLFQNNRTFHQMLVDGIEVEYRQPDGTIRGERVQLVDFDTPENNDWLAVLMMKLEIVHRKMLYKDDHLPVCWNVQFAPIRTEQSKQYR